ncbi:MAG: bifunctional UDP-N-acetylmuramoyl-tripeptide:D-alanyl-D-alanine ligase/alanine racemase [Bacteroides sp.]|nr:bifunctional UDP-N-acetylmuramoyl-tripeptide:D-alanyl-D-alanine ligase/alanine racemase [Bacteroides sp.]MCM1414101.1 bifunctional UDP-N-acetylmuramoyl-tripeptide:D-alanyl-D-alanine ligase/alanine racemase [Bacteroides sp.]MCM1472365.1 bifunctional UDP-N-acetylmuramoyl-tripeptide:D-alanyl-D-alanine ligase/alanine racemase [Bacteroides sp.]
MNYTVSSISKILGGTSRVNADRPIRHLLIDSRSLIYPEESLFFAITTATGDGHKYLRELYDKGVKAFVVSHIPDELATIATDADFITVDNVTKALQVLAKHHRQQLSCPVIGITGSRGKTTVKEWLYQLLGDKMHIVRSPRSFNSQVGVPLSIWELDEDTELGVIEAGISQNGEMESLRQMIRPEIGIITNVNSEHSEGFRSIEQKAEEKALLIRDCECLIYCKDDVLVANAISKVCHPQIEIAWSTKDPDVQLFVRHDTIGSNSTRLSYNYLGSTHEVTLPFTASADIQNAIHCLAVMLYLRRPHDEIAEKMAMLTPVRTRLNVIEGVNNCMLIYDSYTSDLHSLAPALDFMNRRHTAARTTTVILSDIMHETLPASKLYPAVAQLLRQRNVDRLIGIGEEFMRNQRYFDGNAIFYPSTEAFLSSTSTDDFESELILIKGAPDYHFERIADMLEARQHETVLEVNLDAVVHNFNLFRSMVKPTTGIVCMVKASGYGAGSHELAKTLQSHGAAYLAVAVMDEGVDLRHAGITMPIMVLNPKVVNYRTLFAYNLEPEVFSFDVLNQLIHEGEKYGVTDYPIHIKFDTGMHRLGFIEEDIPELIDILRRQKVVRPSSIFSHLAAADCPEMDDYTQLQFTLFDRWCDMLQSQFRHHIQRHILNSTGISRFPEHQNDMVRLGICLYGIPTMNDGSQGDLQQVSSLSTTIISLKHWPAGTTIGYSRNGLCKRDSVIATIPVGYADGINRHLGNGGMSVMINGVRCPSIGNICMDACMIDVTDVDCKVGDRVEIFGPNISVEEIANTLKTIPYEVLTSISMRVKRVYFRE